MWEEGEVVLSAEELIIALPAKDPGAFCWV